MAGTEEGKSAKKFVESRLKGLDFIVIKTHKENFALAERLEVGSFVSVAGISKFRVIICTQLKQLHKMDESKQTILPFR